MDRVNNAVPLLHCWFCPLFLHNQALPALAINGIIKLNDHFKQVTQLKKDIKELIVVEGKDDVSAVRRAVNATILTTSGMGLTPERLAEIRAIASRQGVIVLTDPDVPGTLIRNRIAEAVPECKHAFIARKDARHPRTGRIGVEYAKPEVIARALEKAYATNCTPEARYTMADLMYWGLAGMPGSAERREKFCDLLHLGRANSKALLKRLNAFGLEQAIIDEALAQLENDYESE